MTSAVGQGQVLAGRYRLHELVAAGGAGTVWRAMDLVLERMVAVKLPRPEVTGNPLAAASFLAEARSASRLSHPAIAQVYDYGGAGPADMSFLVMELVDGPSLSEVLVAGPLGPNRTMDLVAQVAAGLHAAHSAGVVHRDIKPANLLTTRHGQVKITDFGIASVIGSAPVPAAGIVIGTPGYLAPERAAGESATPSSDLYSLGVVAYECLTGTRPFSGPASEVSAAHLQQPFPPLPASVPADVALLVAELTARDPSRRPRSAREVAARAATLSPGSAGHTVLPEETRGWPKAGQASPEPVTLTEVVTMAPLGESESQQRSPAWQPRRGWRVAGALLAVGAALAMVGLIGWWAGLTRASGSPSPATPRTAVVPPAPGVTVNSAAFVGLQAGEVLAELRQRGLRPILVHVVTSGQPPGTVLSVQPGGILQPGAIVIVTAAAAVPPQVTGNSGDSGRDGGGSDGGGSGDGGH